MHYFQFEAHPKPSNSSYGIVDGAFINCWVNDPLEASAEAAALAAITEHGWDVERCEESAVVSRETYRNNPTGLAYFEQALLDGVVMAVHRWPVGAPDDE